MRICHIIETAGGGSGQVVIDLARFGIEHGDEVTILYSPDRAETKFIAALEAIPRVNILTSPMQRKIGLHDLSAGWLLWKTLRKAGPFDIIHSHSSKAGGLTRLISPFLPGTVVYTAHAFYSMMPKAPAFYGFIECILSWLAPCVICVSNGEYRHGQKLGISQSKLFLIPNGLAPRFNTSRANARDKLQINDNQILIGFVGRLEPQKNPLRAVSAFGQVIRSHPEAHMIMVGDGLLRSQVEAKCAHLNLQQHIKMLGSCDALSIIPAFDCLLCSSDFEALPLTFIEALAAGIPIITTPVGGTDEAAIEGVTGFISPTQDENDLATTIIKFLSLSAEQRQKMSENARKHSELFTTEIMGEKYRNIYKQYCLSSHKWVPRFFY